nr:glycosyltransferase [Acidobacteriota bacterium]
VMGWVSQQYGSFERFIERLCARCEREGFQSHLVFPATPASSEFVRNVRAQIHVLPLARHPFDPRAWGGLRKIFRATNATHVHAHFGLDAMLAMAVARSLRIRRRFLTKHIVPGTSKIASLRHRWLAAQADVFFAVSDRVANALLDLGVAKEKVVRVYLGVDTNAYRPTPERRAAARAMLGIGNEQVIVCTSHLREGKGVELLPPLAAGLAQNPGNVRVIHAGGGPLREQIESESVNIPLQLLGVRQDIPDLLAAGDLFVFPTTGNEGLPLGPVEAMAAGLPIVASAVSDLPAIAGDALRLVPPGDIQALLTACRELLANHDAARTLGDSAQRAAVERFSVDAAVEAHMARYLA